MKEMLKKVLDILSRSKVYVVTFMISTFIISLLYIFNDVTPFGPKSLLCVDFYHQYGPMLGELYNRLHGTGGFVYSFTMGLGLPFFRNFLNYLSSPFNLLILLFKRENLVTSYSYIIGLKAVIASITFVYYTAHKFKTRDLILVPIGVIYAFSAYYAAYYWNIMWLDGMVFLPLITLGIEYIVNEGKWKFYTLWLAIMLISNYFMGYMICIFSVLYFIVYNFHEMNIIKGKALATAKKFISNCITFGIASLTAGLLAAVLLIPMANSLKSISATGGNVPKTQYYKFTHEDFIKYHLSGTPTTTFASDKITAPNVSIGILGVALLLAFIANLDIPIKTKLCYLFLLGFFIVAFFNPQLDYVLHAFHVPNDLPYRYSYIYIFVLATIGAYGAINMKKMPYLLSLFIYITLIAVLFTMTKSNWSGMSNNMFYINIILLTLYFIFYSGGHFIKDLKNVFIIAIICAVSIDVIVSVNYNWNITQELENFYMNYEETTEKLNYIKNYDDYPFYRVERTSYMTLNDPSWYNYNGVSTFSSMAYEGMAKLHNKLGLPGNHINSYYYQQTTPIYDLMFDIKYFIGPTNDVNRYITFSDDINEFKYNVSLAYGTNKELKNWSYNSSNPFMNQNDYIEKATGVKDVLEKMTPEDSEEIYSDGSEYIVKYNYKNPNDNMYFYTENYAIDFIIIGDCLYYKNDSYTNYVPLVNEISYSILDDYNESNIINIKSQDEYVTIYIGYNSYLPSSYYMYSINEKKMEEVYDILNNNKFNITSFKENIIEGTIYTEKDYVYTSIPYDEGWEVYVDDKKVNTYKLGDALLTFDIEPGTHKVVFKYVPKGIKSGILGTLTGITIIVLSIIYDKKIVPWLDKKKSTKKKIKKKTIKK